MLFELPDEHLAEGPAPHKAVPVTIRLSDFSLKNPRQYGGCWMFCDLWEKFGLDGLPGQDGEVVVYVESADRVMKERAMRLRRVRKLLKRLAAISKQSLGYAALLQKIGAAKHEAGRDQRYVQIDLPRPPRGSRPGRRSKSSRRSR